MENKNLLQTYLTEPELFWPISHMRNVKKLDSFIGKGKALNGESKKAFIQNVINLAELRRSFSSNHLYLVNAGSSGSHWVEAMLGLLPGFHNAGEVYIPNEISRQLSLMPKDEANTLLDVLYLIHSGGMYEDSLYASLSNSAHLADHSSLSKYSQKSLAIFLMRNPVDIVMSRSFRKDEYKNDVAPNMDQQAYLEKNCQYVENFYSLTDATDYNLKLRYEDFVEFPVESLRKLADSLGLNSTYDEIKEAVRLTSKEEVEKSISKGEAAITNVYVGEKKERDWARSYVRERLHEVLVKYDYV
ncbi:sulfotransferase domain-containing protein [Cobetia sp. QF-1]|uniref:sulfotransferase domain-containing protein n=1 Tax=Cobetia sp. QF-1 TaxID=1969833 RepID=UPI000B544519|nr:sulfotransferase domain-containing protein [Cobetia sp. QF-1]